MLAYRGLAAEAAAAATPTPSSQTLPTPILEAQNFNNRVETAIAQAQAQLAAPKTAPAELTAEEQAEAQRNSAWNALSQQRQDDIACASASNQASFQDQALAALLNDAEMGNLTVPDCSDLLTWDSDSNSSFDAKAVCVGVSVHKLMARFGN
jgi:Skp family chaperone for outer membrane proteins